MLNAYSFIDFSKGETTTGSNVSAGASNLIQEVYPSPPTDVRDRSVSSERPTNSELPSPENNRTSQPQADALQLNESVRVAEQLFGADDVQIAALLNPLARYYLDNGHYRLAQAILERSVRLQKLHETPVWDHDAIVANLGLSEVSKKLGDTNNATALQEQFDRENSLYTAKRILLFSLRDESDDSIYRSLGQLALTFDKSGQQDKAEQLFGTAITLIQQKYGPNTEKLQNIVPAYKQFLEAHDKSVPWVSNMAAHHEEWAEKQRQARLASSRAEQRNEPEPQSDNEGPTETARINAEGADPAVRKAPPYTVKEEQRLLDAMSICQTVFGPNSKETAAIFARLGALVAGSDSQPALRAESYFSHALAIYSSPKLHGSAEHIEVLTQYAEVLSKSGLDTRGNQLEETAKRLRRELNAKDNLIAALQDGALRPESALALAELGNAYSINGDRSQAGRAFNEGVALLSRLNFPDSEATCAFMEQYSAFLLASGDQEQAHAWMERARQARVRVENKSKA